MLRYVVFYRNDMALRHCLCISFRISTNSKAAKLSRCNYASLSGNTLYIVMRIIEVSNELGTLMLGLV